jgi:hypothetical protein
MLPMAFTTLRAAGHATDTALPIGGYHVTEQTRGHIERYLHACGSCLTFEHI